MSEILAILYLVVHALYLIYARRSYVYQGCDDSFFVIIGRPIYQLLPNRITDRLINSEERLKLQQLHSQKMAPIAMVVYQQAKLGIVYTVLAIGGLFALVLGLDYVPSQVVPNRIERPSYGEEVQAYQLTYWVDGEGVKRQLPVEIQPRMPEESEAMALLESHYLPLLIAMIPEGNEKDRLVEDLHFSEQPFDNTIYVTYTSLTPDYLTDQGQLRRNRMELNQGYPIQVMADMHIGSYHFVNTYDLTAYKLPLAFTEDVRTIPDRVIEGDGYVVLPDQLEDQEEAIHWVVTEQGVQWYKIIGLSWLLAALFYTLKKRDLDKGLLKRREAILYDFPDVVNKLTMLLNAGMTFHRAWQKIVMDYQERKQALRPLYEEMLVMSNQMVNGMPEVEALASFGRRTGNKEVIRMTAILIQNLKRGNNALTMALVQLSQEAWEIRTTIAKKLGEEASTKLLLPMGISLITVMLIVIAPTLMSIKL